jgi:hypothetical protein
MMMGLLLAPPKVPLAAMSNAQTIARSWTLPLSIDASFVALEFS